MKLSENEVLDRALKSVSDQNTGWLNGRPTMNHPMERAHLVTAVMILRSRGAYPFGPWTVETLKHLAWPAEVAEQAAEIADNALKYDEEERLSELWSWPEETIASWFEGDT